MTDRSTEPQTPESQTPASQASKSHASQFQASGGAMAESAAERPSLEARRWQFNGLWFGLIATVLTVVGYGAVLLIAVTNEALFEDLARKDFDDGGGLFEHMTVVVMGIGVGAGVYAFVKYRKRLPNRLLRLWLLGWIVACFYFMGEEASWGQWYFGWGTPEAWAQLNKQDETNLHNTSKFLGYYPELMVRLFVVIPGCLLPAYLWLAKRPAPLEPMGRWVIATWACWAAGFCMLISWMLAYVDLSPVDRVSSSEFRELLVAWFLTIYLFSFVFRLRAAPEPVQDGDRGGDRGVDRGGGASA